MCDEKYPELTQVLDELVLDTPAIQNAKADNITFHVWRKIENPQKTKSGKKASPITRKEPVTQDFKSFINELKKELSVLKEHLFRVHMQYIEHSRKQGRMPMMPTQ